MASCLNVTSVNTSPQRPNSPSDLAQNRLLRYLVDFTASGFFSGHIPKAPGTCGTLVATGLAFVLYNLLPQLTSIIGMLSVAIFITLLGILVSNKAIDWNLYGPNCKDPQKNRYR